VIARDHELTLKGGLLEPCHGLLKLRETALVCEIAGVDQHVAWRELGKAVVSVGDAYEASTTEA
jgi:hypothetical protein